MTTEETRQFIQAQITSFEAPIQQATILQKAFKAGGEVFAKDLEATTGKLGSLIAVKEALEAELAALTD